MPNAIEAAGVSKYYAIWSSPSARLKHPFLGVISRALPPLRPWVERTQPGLMSQFHALEEVSLTVRRGECVGIIGRNGSGKSTLLRIIAGVLQPTAGRVAVQGRIAALLELGSGFNPEFTGRQNVYLNAAILGLTREETDARFDEIAAFAEIGAFIDQPVKTYSSGMAVRLAFAVSATVDPDILIVDEALSVGDEAFQRKCYGRLESLRQRGATILFVSHAASIIVQLCDRAVLMYDGRLILSGSPKIVVGRYQRLLHAPPEQHARLLAEIRALGEDSSGEPAPPTLPAPEAPPTPTPGSAEAEYDAALATTSTLEYPSRGARIEDVRIEDETGRRVNALPRGVSFYYCFEIHFAEAQAMAAAGYLIKTITGLELGGATSHIAGDGWRDVAAGTRFTVRFPFVANLNPGRYFMNAGVVLLHGPGSIEYLHRVIDALSFRVLPEKGLLQTGIVDFTKESQPARMTLHPAGNHQAGGGGSTSPDGLRELPPAPRTLF